MSAKPFDTEDFVAKLVSVVSLCERGSTEGERQAGMSAFTRMAVRAEAEARSMPNEQGRAFLARVAALQPQTADVREAAERKRQAEAEAACKAAEQARREREAREKAAREAQVRREREAQERFIRQAEERAERLEKEAREREALEAQAARDRAADTPSMEDVLESIRRILDEDDTTGPHATAEKPVDPAERADAEGYAEAAAEQEAWARRQKAAWQAEQDEKRQRAQASAKSQSDLRGAAPRAETLENILAEVHCNPRRPTRARPLVAVCFCVPMVLSWLVCMNWAGETAHPALATSPAAVASPKPHAVPAKQPVAAATPAKQAVFEGFTPIASYPDELMRQARATLTALQSTLDRFQDDNKLAVYRSRQTLMLDLLAAKEGALQAQIAATTLRYTVSPSRQAQLLDLADRLDDTSIMLRHVAKGFAGRIAEIDGKTPARQARNLRG